MISTQYEIWIEKNDNFQEMNLNYRKQISIKKSLTSLSISFDDSSTLKHYKNKANVFYYIIFCQKIVTPIKYNFNHLLFTIIGLE